MVFAVFYRISGLKFDVEAGTALFKGVETMESRNVFCYEKITIVSNCTKPLSRLLSTQVSIDDRISRVRTALFWTKPPCGRGGCCGWGHSFGWTIVDYLKRSWREPWRGRGGMDGEQRKTWTDRLTDDGWLFLMRDGKLWHLDPAINCGGKLWREIIG